MKSFLRKYNESTFYSAYSRGIAIDFITQKLFFFEPNVIKLLENKLAYSIEEILNQNEKNNLSISLCIEELVKKDIVFKCQDINFFPSLNYTELSYSIIENIEIEFSTKIFEIKDLIFQMITDFRIKAVKFILKDLNKSEIIELVDFFSYSSLESIECVFDYTINNISFDFLKELVLLNGIITRFSISNIPSDFYCEIDDYVVVGNEELNFPKLLASFKLFSESQNFHTFFFKKLFISKDGLIKNSKDSQNIIYKIFDEFNLNKLKIEIQRFINNKLWFVKKEETDVCKDCEFRHMCVDNRLPYERNQNEWYHKIECNYNPYISKWKDEEGYRTLAECGVISNEEGFLIDHEKIAEINKELWGEEIIDASTSSATM